MLTKDKPIVIAITGASGSPYSLLLMRELLAQGFKIALLISKAAQLVIATETELQLSGKMQNMQRQLEQYFEVGADQLQVYGQEQWNSPVASGSALMGPMIVCPCSMGCLSAIATGASNNLLERAADVAIKEKRQLILVPRETPFSAIHLQNMLSLAQLGVTIMPAAPGFYHQPQQVDDLVKFMVARILDHLGVAHQLQSAWGYAN